MANIPELFPPADVLAYLSSGEHPEIAAYFPWALAYPQETAQPDKELHRFMPLDIDWNKFHPSSLSRSGCKYLAGDIWMSDIYTMPFVPKQLPLLHGLVEKSNSIAHLTAVTAQMMHILFVPQDREAIIDLSLLLDQVQRDVNRYHASVCIIIVEKNGSLILKRTVRGIRGIQVELLVGYVGEGGTVNYATQEQYSDSAYGMRHETWLAGEKASIVRKSIVRGGKQTWQAIDYVLEKEASVEHSSLAIVKETEQAALITRQIHQGPSSKSLIQVKSLLYDASRTFYRGLIEIEESAKGSEADQQQRSLILGSEASSCAIPALEVATDDVRCKHGSAAGYVKQEEITYLVSRGLDEQGAIQLLIDAFVGSSVEGIDCKNS